MSEGHRSHLKGLLLANGGNLNKIKKEKVMHYNPLNNRNHEFFLLIVYRFSAMVTDNCRVRKLPLHNHHRTDSFMQESPTPEIPRGRKCEEEKEGY